MIIINRNSRGERHGYQEQYFHLFLRGNFKNGVFIGYIEWCDAKQIYFYIK